VAYATLQTLIDRYGQDQLLVLADRDADGEIDTDITDRALADAEAEIDGYLATRYELPLATVPPVLSRLAADIALYRLCDDDAMVTDERRRRYDDALSLLGRISSGVVSLGVSPQPSARQAAAAFYAGKERNFGRRR
jgi:phage gp36-like protein